MNRPRTKSTSPAPVAGSARDQAMACLSRQARRFPELDLRPPQADRLDQRDTALLRAIDQAARRRWLTLSTVMGTLLRRPWDDVAPAVQGALLAGAAQLLILERLPDHAVINAAVDWVKASRSGRPAAGFVNAVLRRVADLRLERGPAESGTGSSRRELPLDDGRVLRLANDVFSADPTERLAEQTSHPIALLQRWQNRLGLGRMTDLARHDLVQAPLIVTGYDTLPPGCEQHEETGFAVVTQPAHLDDLLASGPHVRVQDPGAARAVETTADLRPRVIVDLCAGRGTKTRQLARMHPDARIIATDRNRHRIAVLREVFAETPNVEVVNYKALAGPADLVVVDAPCSNTAALGRRVEARYRVSDDTLSALVSMQRQALVDGLRVLAEGGYLLYSTCSLEAEENEHQVQWLTRWHPLRLDHKVTHWPASVPGDPPVRYRDGGFAAVLQHKGVALAPLIQPGPEVAGK